MNVYRLEALALLLIEAKIIATLCFKITTKKKKKKVLLLRFQKQQKHLRKKGHAAQNQLTKER